MSGKELKIGMVGATGVVGEVFLKLIEERKTPFSELRLFASEASKGQTRSVCGKEWTLDVLHEGCFDGLDLVFFSSGDGISKEWAPKAAKAGAFAIDNSAAFRMDENTILAVPEVNGELLPSKDNPAVIANPNCSTIQLVVALRPLQKAFGINSVKVSSYQAASGAGRDAMAELIAQMQQTLEKRNVECTNWPKPLAFNCLPEIGSWDTESGFCTEELKIMRETRKILAQPELNVSAFTVRIPAMVGHSEAVWVTLDREASREEVVQSLKEAKGVEFMDADYPTALSTEDKDPVYVGRLHRDPNDSKTWIMWVVADNLRKGAALNGLQIAEAIFDIQQNS